MPGEILGYALPKNISIKTAWILYTHLCRTIVGLDYHPGVPVTYCRASSSAYMGRCSLCGAELPVDTTVIHMNVTYVGSTFHAACCLKRQACDLRAACRSEAP